MTRTITLITVAAALALPVTLGAHEGHEHTVMGTVQKIEGTTLVVKAVDAKTRAETTVTIVLGEESELLRGVAAVTAADIKPGERIVVKYVTTKSTDGKETHTAKQVRLADATSSIGSSK